MLLFPISLPGLKACWCARYTGLFGGDFIDIPAIPLGIFGTIFKEGELGIGLVLLIYFDFCLLLFVFPLFTELLRESTDLFNDLSLFLIPFLLFIVFSLDATLLLWKGFPGINFLSFDFDLLFSFPFSLLFYLDLFFDFFRLLLTGLR